MVTVGDAGGKTVGGLTWQIGGLTACTGVITQLERSTEPLNPPSGLSARVAVAEPPGSTENGVKVVGCIVKSWPTAAGKNETKAAINNRRGTIARTRCLAMSMSSFEFK